MTDAAMGGKTARAYDAVGNDLCDRCSGRGRTTYRRMTNGKWRPRLQTPTATRPAIPMMPLGPRCCRYGRQWRRDPLREYDR
ncbi:MAG: hypothetical protein ACLRSD_11130 [Oscillibacter sp.]